MVLYSAKKFGYTFAGRSFDDQIFTSGVSAWKTCQRSSGRTVINTKRASKARNTIKLILLFAGLSLTNHSVVAQLDHFLEFEKYFPLTVFLGIWFSALAALLYVAFTPRRIERVIWVLLIGVSTLLAEAYYLITGDRITIQALDGMWDPSLIRLDMVGFYGTYFLQASISTLILLIGLLISSPTIKIFRLKITMLTPVVPCLLLGGLVYYIGASTAEETRGMPSQFLYLGLFPIFAISDPQPLEKSEVELDINAGPRVKNVVLIVDESVSGDFVDLNRMRGTTPFLLSEADIIANFGLAISATNCSYSSNAILRLGADPRRIGEPEYSILAHPSVWKYARLAGFETTFIEAQHISARRQYFMNDNELALVDNILTISDDNGYERDVEVANKLTGILSRPGPQFVYINKFGAHFPYHRSYPENREIFSPAMQAYESITDRPRLVNAYKNAVRWSVDEFFSSLLPGIDLSETVLIYTSDHGQNLLDDGNPVTHCRRSQETIAEALIPLLVMTMDENLNAAFSRAAVKNHNLASHFEIFPTLLNLFGYDPKSVEKRYYQSLLEPIDEPLGFISGPVTGRFGRQPDWQPRGTLDNFER